MDEWDIQFVQSLNDTGEMGPYVVMPYDHASLGSHLECVRRIGANIFVSMARVYEDKVDAIVPLTEVEDLAVPQ